jgi:DNA-directed RNA polymerase subunit RPC12/RpoP
MGRTIGIILIVAGVLICGVVSLFMGIGALAAGEGPGVSRAGAVLGIALLGVVPFLILGGVGVFLFIKGGQEAVEMADVREKERLMGMVQAAGKVSLANAAIELKMTRDQVKNAILDLVNQGLFSGYINWQEQMFYSKDLSQMQSTKCPNCGGQREAVGKGLVKCPYCGVELFLPPS